MNKQKLTGWIIIIGLIILIATIELSGIDLVNLMIKTNQEFYKRFGQAGIYIATILVSLLGTMTIILPSPYLLAVVTILLTVPVNPFLLGVSSAIGACIGELTAWILGIGASDVLKKKTYINKIKGLTELIKKGYGFQMIILYAATPLPDDILFIALGMERYPLKKSLLAGFIGKLILVYALIIAIFFMKNTVIGQTIMYFYGLETTSTGAVISTGDTTVTTITMIITLAITIILITTDWERVWKALKKQKS